MNKEKIIISLLAIAAAMGTYLIYNQDSKIQMLERIIKSNEAIYTNPDALSSGEFPSKVKSRFSTEEQLAGFFESNIKTVEGTVISIDAGSIKIQAKIVDVKKLASLANVPDEKSLPFLEKTYAIKLPAGFDTKKLQIGNYVAVYSDELVYGTNKLTASSVNVLRASQ